MSDPKYGVQQTQFSSRATREPQMLHCATWSGAHQASPLLPTPGNNKNKFHAPPEIHCACRGLYLPVSYYPKHLKSVLVPHRMARGATALQQCLSTPSHQPRGDISCTAIYECKHCIILSVYLPLPESMEANYLPDLPHQSTHQQQHATACSYCKTLHNITAHQSRIRFPSGQSSRVHPFKPSHTSGSPPSPSKGASRRSRPSAP